MPSFLTNPNKPQNGLQNYNLRRIMIMNFICFVSVIHLDGCHAKARPRSILLGRVNLPHASASTSRSKSSGSIVGLDVRGGSDSFGYGRGAVKPKTSSPSSSSSSSSSRQRFSFQDTVDQDPTPEEVTGKDMMNTFLSRESRNTFIARVYAILAGQLLVTGISIVLFGTQPALRRWTMGGSGNAVPGLSLLVSTVAWTIMCMNADARRKSPRKWWLLGLFTLGEAIAVGYISAFYVFRSVLSAMFATALATGAVSFYAAFQRNATYDLTRWGTQLSSCALIFLVYGIIGLLQMIGKIPTILPYNDALFSMVGACLFSFYLAYHTRLIVGGKHSKYQFGDKDYVFGAMALYDDIIQIFIYILRVIGEDRDRKK